MDNYRTRKLLERYLEPVALKHNLSMTEIWVLFYLCHPHNVRTRRELADFIDISRSALSMALKKLTLKGLIKIEDLRSPKQLVISYSQKLIRFYLIFHLFKPTLTKLAFPNLQKKN